MYTMNSPEGHICACVCVFVCVCVCKQALRSQEHEAYVQASSLLKLTSQTSVDGDSDEVTKKREEVAAKLMAGAPDGVVDMLDSSLDYGRVYIHAHIHRNMQYAI
jgi:hypothetical protein